MTRSITHPTLLLALTALLTACAGPAATPEGFYLSDEPLPGKVVWHDLMSDDVETAQAFYGELLGWSFEPSQRPDGTPYVLAKAGSRFVAGFVEVEDPPQGEYSRWLGYLSVPDVDQAVARTRAMGGSIVIEPRQVGQVGRAAVIRDSEGAPVGLLRVSRGDPDDGFEGRPGGVGWNELLAGDAERAVAFYADIAGYETRVIERRKGEYHVLSDGQRDRVGIFTNPLEGTDPAWLTHFTVADVLAASERVGALGGTVLLAPSADFRDGRVAFIRDPGGAVLVLTQAK